MGSPGSTSNITREDVRTVFTRLDQPSTPLTAAEVAENLDCTRQTAQRSLEELVESGELRTKQMEGAAQVWWRSGARKSVGQRSEQEEYSAFVNAVEDYAIFMLDPDGVIVSWNEGANRIKGYGEDEIVGEHVSAFYTDADIDDGVPGTNLETAAAEGRVEDEGWRVRRDGSRFWANVVITAVRDDDGTLRGFTKVTRDMTEQRAYEQRIRRERDFTERILETVPVSICLIAPDGDLVRANRRMLDRLGAEESDLSEYGVDSWEIYDAEGEPIPIEEWPWTRVIETGDPVYDYQCQVALPDIGHRWLSLSAAPIEREQREDDLVVVSIDDITDRKERERRLRREYDQTEKLLRTAPVAIAVQNAEGETVMANQRAQDALGLSEQEFVEEPGDAEWKIYDANGDPLAPDETPAARVLATGEPLFDQEISIKPPSGERMQFRVNAAPLFGPDGTIERVVTASEDITELKKRERKLEQRKSELETEVSEILGRISDAFYALDDEWRFTHLNERAADIMQRSREELLGREVWEVFPDATDSIYWEQFRTAMDTQEPVSFEVYDEGLDAWLAFNAYPSDSGLSIYFRDVTERWTRERELEESERRYRTLAEHFPNGAVALVGEDLRYRTVGGSPLDVADVTAEELKGKPVGEVLPPKLADELVSRYEAALDGESGAFEMGLDDRFYQFQVVPVRDDDGAIFAALGMSQDITERVEAQRKLEESERRYRTLVENFPNGAVGLYNDNLEYIIAGGEAFDDLDVPKEEVIGSSIAERYPTDLVAEIEPHYRAALEGESNTFEYRFQDRDVWAHTLPVRNDEGEIFGGMIMAQDITERREYERKLKESNERLEQFAYAASHDLQEPLRMVSSYLQLLERRYAGELDEEGREFIEFAVDGAERMGEMIDRLLEYSRVETQGDPFEPTDLDEVLEHVRDDLQIQIAESDAVITAESLPRVEGDPSQLRQVFQNLLDNAIEYSGDDPPRIHVSAERVGDEWRTSVSDNGIGIDPDDADRVFRVFQRLHTHEEHAGTGLGLALCRRIIERHGGDIWVESNPGEGATFSFTLPAVDETERDRDT